MREAEPDPVKRAGAMPPIERFLEQTDWQPDSVASFAGSMTYLRRPWMMRLIWRSTPYQNQGGLDAPTVMARPPMNTLTGTPSHASPQGSERSRIPAWLPICRPDIKSPVVHPKRGVGAEAVTQLRVIPFNRSHRADIAFLDEVDQRKSARAVFLRDRDHQPEVMSIPLLSGDADLFKDDLQVIDLFSLFTQATSL
jgi:hypothetical protein